VTGASPADPGRLAARLVGPAGPEVGCDECFEQLDVYVELELAGEAADQKMPLMFAHLRGCPACLDDHDSLLALLRADPHGQPQEPA
jgi:AhpD family alkylhydroperoxidase